MVGSRHVGDALWMDDLGGERVTVEGVARLAAGDQHGSLGAVGGGGRDVHAELEAGAGLAGPTRHSSGWAFSLVLSWMTLRNSWTP